MLALQKATVVAKRMKKKKPEPDAADQMHSVGGSGISEADAHRARKTQRKLSTEGKSMSISDIRRISRTNVLHEQLERSGLQNALGWAQRCEANVVHHLIEISTATYFANGITSVICVAGLLAGIRTFYDDDSPEVEAIEVCDLIIALIFLAEVLIKLGAQGTYPWRYFWDSWNVFDFVIVVLLLSVPKGSQAAQILPLVRLFRILKLVNAIPELQILVTALLKSLVSIGSVFVLLFILFYMYTVLAVFLFSNNDPFHFENLHVGMLTMYRVSTFEDWTDVMYINMYGCSKYSGGIYQTNQTTGEPLQPGCSLEQPDPGSYKPYMQCKDDAPLGAAAAFFFCSFSLFATMIMFNLFIGVILANMERSKIEITEDINRLGENLKLGDKVASLTEEELSYMERASKVRDMKIDGWWINLREAVVENRKWRKWKGGPDEDPSEALAGRLSKLLLEELDMSVAKLEDLVRLKELLEVADGGDLQREPTTTEQPDDVETAMAESSNSTGTPIAGQPTSVSPTRLGRAESPSPRPDSGFI